MLISGQVYNKSSIDQPISDNLIKGTRPEQSSAKYSFQIILQSSKDSGQFLKSPKDLFQPFLLLTLFRPGF